MRNDLANHVDPQQSLRPAGRTASANGVSVDLRRFDAAMVVIDAGTWTDGTHTFEVQDSDDDSTFAAVADDFLDGTEAVIDGATDDDQIYKIGYHGIKRYLRVAVTVAAATTGAVYSATITRGKGSVKP